MEEERSPEQLCRAGKEMFFAPGAEAAAREQGLRLLLKAQKQGDPEAAYLVATLILEGALTVRGQDPEDHAMRLISYAAEKGWLPARARLNAMCQLRYRQNYPTGEPAEGPLRDFEGNPITIARTGFLTPVDAVLSYENGKNILTLSTNVRFVYTEEIPDPDGFEQAVLKGFRAWSGEYRVFGGQRLQVRVELSLEDKFFDHLTVIPVTGTLHASLQQAAAMLGNRRVENIAKDRRSFATMGVRWSATSRKTVWIQGQLDDQQVVCQTAKHEFGHVLGLGDLYESASDSMAGVALGTYPELDCYGVTDKLYHLVMCNSAGPVSNNDIEMVVLAFRENRLQLYQEGPVRGKLSEALGKGD